MTLGVGRSLLALAELFTLALTPDHDLFPELGERCGGLRAASLWCLGHGSGCQDVMRYLAIIVLATVVIGYRPRWTCVPHWYIAFSLGASLVTPNGGEQIAKVVALLLIPILLGDDRAWHWAKPPTSMAPRWCGAAAASHLMVRALVVSVYLQALVTKLVETPWRDGHAMHYVLQDPYFGATPWVAALLENAVPVMTWGAMVAEAALALSPFAGDRIRGWAIAVGAALHIAIAVVLGLVSFGMTMVGLLCVNALLRDHQARSTRRLSLARWMLS
jgi:antimicrobial peptide system SdpB family protein